MADDRFDLIFRGDIVLGQSLTDVKQRLQQLFKADAAKIESLFSGRPVPLKRQLDRATAEKYQAVLHKAGAQVTLVPSEAEQGKAPKAPIRPGAGAGSEPQPQRQPQPAQSAGLSLAPVGGLLLSATERTRFTPREVDVSRLSLRPVGGDLLDGNERPEVVATLSVVPEFDIAEVGAELLSPDERGDLPVMAVEPEDWGLAEAGSDLLKPQERAPEPTPPNVAADFDLAPAGSDMGQLKSQQTPLDPDISGLRLEE